MAGPIKYSRSSRVLEYMLGHPGASSQECADAIGCTKIQAAKLISEHRIAGRLPYPAKKKKRMIETLKLTPIEDESPPPSPPELHQPGLEGFRQLFDRSLIIPRKIREKIGSYLKDKGWDYDETFRQVCGVSSGDWRRFKDEFAHLQIKAPNGRWVWGHPDIIDEMREIALR